MSSTARWYLKAWPFRPSYTAPCKNITRRPRQTTKGTAVKNGMWGLPEQRHFVCGVFERRVTSGVEIFGVQCLRAGTPGLGTLGPWCPLAGTPDLGIMTRIRTRGFLLRVLFARWRKNARTRSNCARKMVKNRRCQPVGSLVGHLGLQCPLLGTRALGSPWLFGPAVSPCGSTRPWEHDAGPNPRFVASGPPHSLVETRKKPPLLRPQNSSPTVPTRHETRWAFGSAMSPSGNTSPWLFGPVMSPSGNTRPREHVASLQPTVSRVVVYSPFGVKSKAALTAPEGARRSE